MPKRKSWSGQAKATQKYQKNVLERHSFNLNRNTDQDIIEHIANIGNLQGYLKMLIRNDIALDNKNVKTD